MNLYLDFLDKLNLSPMGEGHYLGRSHDLGLRHLFGGHVLAQALMAAFDTVSPDRHCHSLHAYFLRPGRGDEDVEFHVRKLRDGAGFSAREVSATQGKSLIFMMSASFCVDRPSFEHATPMPGLAGPHELADEVAWLASRISTIPEDQLKKLFDRRCIEVRVSDGILFAAEPASLARKYSWMRPKPGSEVLSIRLSQALMAYSSDFGFASTALLPHGYSYFDEGIRVASIDHSIWFHRPFIFNDWFVYLKDSPTAFGGRGLNRGQIFSHDGALVATAVQESLIVKS